MKAVNGVRADGWPGNSLVGRQRFMLPLWWSVLILVIGKLITWTAAFVVHAARAWRVTVPVVALLTLYARFRVAGLVVLVLGLAVILAVWRWRWPAGFSRHIAQRTYGRLRWWWTYRRRWASVMDGVALSRTTDTGVFVPEIVAVWSTRIVDEIHLRLLHGQTPADVSFVAEGLRHAFGAHRAVVNEMRPGRVSVRFYTRDPLVNVVPALPIPDATDLDALPVGLTETGVTYLLRVIGTHLLIVGSTGAGKGSVLWSILRALVPAIRSGLVKVYGIDPKGGMELWPGLPLFASLAMDRAEQMAELLEAAVVRMVARRDRLRSAGIRKHVASVEDPHELIVIDELAFLTAYLPDRKVKERIATALSLLLTQGRAVGFTVIAAVQDPRKEAVPARTLFPTRIGLRLAEEGETEMTLGEEALNAGALCHLIPDTSPGVAYVHLDGIAEPVRVRFGWVTDDDIATMRDLVTVQPATPTEPTSPDGPDRDPDGRRDDALLIELPTTDETSDGESTDRRSA